MFLKDMLISCLRRWYFVVVGLIITGFITYFAFTNVSPTYEAKGSIVLIPPAVAVTVGDNPYLYLGGLDQALGVLQVKVVSPEVAAPLLEKFPGAVITIVKDATTSGPIMSVAVSANDPGATMELLQGAMKLVPATLESLQQEQKVPAQSVITSMLLSSDLEPTTVAKKQIQMTAIAGVGGLAATLLLTGFIDRLMSRRRDTKQKNRDRAPEAPFGPMQLVAAGQEPDAADLVDDNGRPAGPAADRPARRTKRQRVPEADSPVVESSADVGT